MTKNQKRADEAFDQASAEHYPHFTSLNRGAKEIARCLRDAYEHSLKGQNTMAISTLRQVADDCEVLRKQALRVIENLE